MQSAYVRPRRTQNPDGRQRRIGFELEFSNLEVEEVAAIVADTFSGSVSKHSDIEIEVECGDTGSFKVELDWQFGKKIAEERRRESARRQDGQDAFMEGLKWLAEQVVPVEIVCPPLPLDELAVLDTMVERLRNAGAKGTDESFLYAFGVHINPEVPSFEAEVLVRYLQAFALAQKWLDEKNDVDPVRRLTPYIKPYPEKYVEMILAYRTAPALDRLIDDYFRHNATRNRALDLLPLWKHLAPEAFARNGFADDLTKARPTLHYRLPNCEIEKDGWYLSKSWNLWCVVEQLADDRSLLASLSEQFKRERERGFFSRQRSWHRQLEQLFDDLQ